MYQFIIVIHVLLGLGIIGLVMMQRGKGADAGAAFGSASSGSVFGAQGAASFLSRTTAIFATLFFISSLGLAMLGGYQNEKVDVMDAPAVEDVKEDVPLVDGSGSDAPPVGQDSPQQVIDNAPAAGPAIDTVEAPATDTTE
ncbi:preprotein translocase subunit SecG [Methylomarinum vadi]|uniref:preprotein translocase subunit SecG n=1 Tax=Methylomarinum vadi TaxID=438855 RepID=UPI00068D6169|nr:preprotein translocase subunit SecG [Methylomarinum vadi]